jgi:hypothetical protein
MELQHLLESFTQLDYDHLLEMSVQEIKNFETEFDPNYSNNMDDLITFYYEMEYKWYYLSHNPFTGSPRRKESILAIFESKFQAILRTMAKAFSEVFKEWLSKHALANPREWAEKRVEQALEIDDDYSQALGSGLDEYDRYANKSHDNPFVKLSSTAIKIINNLPTTQEYLQAINEEIADDQEEERGSSDDYRDLFEDIEQFFGSMYKWNVALAHEFLIQFNEKVVFPVWFKHWKAHGIVETRERNEQIYNELQKIETYPLSEQLAIINYAVTATHQGGSMLQYFEMMYGVDENFFDQFEENAPDEWEEELKQIGVDMSTN